MNDQTMTAVSSTLTPYAGVLMLGLSVLALFSAEFGSTSAGGLIWFAGFAMVTAFVAWSRAAQVRQTRAASVVVAVAALVASLAGVLPAHDGTSWDDLTTAVQTGGCVAMVAVSAAIAAVGFFQIDLHRGEPSSRRLAAAVVGLTAAGALATASLMSAELVVGLAVSGAVALVAAVVIARESPSWRLTGIVAAVLAVALVSEAGLALVHLGGQPSVAAVRIFAPLALLVIGTVLTVHLRPAVRNPRETATA